MPSDPPHSGDEKRKKRVEVLYRGFGVPVPLTRSPFMFRRFVALRGLFSFGFEDKDVANNALLSRLWRWSLPGAAMTLALLLQMGLFAGGGWLKYLVYTQADAYTECFLFVAARGAAWGMLMGFLALLAVPMAAAQWRGRRVLMDIKLTALKPREILAAIWLPPLHMLILPAAVFAILDFFVIPAIHYYREGGGIKVVEYEAATLAGLLFQFSMIYMAMMIVFTAAIRPAMRERSAGIALWFTLGWTIHHTAIAALKFFFNIFFIGFIIIICAGQPGMAILLYGAWFGYHVCDGLKETIAEHLREADKHWWAWISGEH